MIAPEANNCVLSPLQISASLLTETSTLGKTVTVTDCVSEQFPSDPETVTVYVVVLEGEAVGFELFGSERPVEGDQL